MDLTQNKLAKEGWWDKIKGALYAGNILNSQVNLQNPCQTLY